MFFVMCRNVHTGILYEHCSDWSVLLEEAYKTKTKVSRKLFVSLVKSDKGFPGEAERFGILTSVSVDVKCKVGTGGNPGCVIFGILKS